MGGGNRSGSSGYDSGSQDPSDDEQKGAEKKITDASSTSSSSSFAVVSRAPPKHGQLFRDDDDPVVHHQAAILSPDGRPVLHIVEQNPDYVQSIAVSVGGSRSFVGSDGSNANVPRSYHISNGSSAIAKVSVHPVPTRHAVEDNVGVAQILHKENRYVQSIVIGSPEGNSATLSSISKLSQSQGPPLPLQPVSKKPSVTFSERVELVAPDRNVITNGKVVVINAQPPPYRKPSNEQDSIVTESLLLLTSSKPLGQDLNKSNNSNNRSNDHSSKSGGERKVSSSSSSSIGDTGAPRIQDLEAFSSSIRQNRPVKHIRSNSGKSIEINPAADHYSSSEYLDHHNNYHHSDDSSRDSDGQGHSYDETGSSSHDTNEDVEVEESRRGSRRPRSAHKSPFGGIADHYAAAKEIAKEIESYSNGSAKTNSKKSKFICTSHAFYGISQFS